MKGDITTLSKGTYIIHYLFHGASTDLEKKDGVLPNFENGNPVIIGEKSYKLEVQNHWSRNMIVLVIGDAPTLKDIGNYVDDFSTEGNNDWVYGYSTDYNFDTNNFTFNAATRVDENEWSGGEGIIIKKDWFLSEADGKDLAVGYVVPEGNSYLTVDITFNGKDEVETRFAARVLVVDSEGNTKSCQFIGDGQQNADWTSSVEVFVGSGDTVYTIFFKENDGWRQGDFNIEIKGQRSNKTPLHTYSVVGEFNGWDVGNGTALTFDPITKWHTVSLHLDANEPFKIVRDSSWGEANEFWWHFADKDPEIIGKNENAIALDSGTYTFGLNDALTSAAYFEGILEYVSVSFVAD